MGETPDFSGIKVIVKMTNGKTKEVSFKDLTIGFVDTSTIGTKTVTASYKGFQFNFEITVVEQVLDFASTITGYSMPTSFTLFTNGNRNVKDNKEDEFKIKDDVYYVGTDNAFMFFPVVTALKPNGVEVVVKQFSSDITIKYDNSGTFEDASTDMVEIVDAQTGCFQFKTDAIGKTFKITQKPNDSRFANIISGVASSSLSFEFKVVEGYNAYSIKELNLIDNMGVAWAEYRSTNNITKNPNEISTMIMHNDISLEIGSTSDKIPTYFTQTINGETYINTNGNLAITSGLFRRLVESGKTFSLIGNYFTLDALKFPQLYTGDLTGSDLVGKKANLFSIASYSVAHPIEGSPAEDEFNAAFRSELNDGFVPIETTFKNLRIIGNTPRTSDYNFGGLNLFRNTDFSSNMKIDNVIANSFSTFAMVSKYNKFEVSNSRFYDAFSFAFEFNNVGEDGVKFVNTEIKRSGGPLLYIYAKESGYKYVGSSEGDSELKASYVAETPKSYVYVASDCVLENLVDGNEPWFDYMGAKQLVTTLVGLDKVFKPTSSNVKTLLSGGKVNMIATLGSDGDPTSANYIPLGGVIYFDVANEDEIFKLNTQDSTFTNLNSSYGASKVPIFTNKTASAYFNGSTLSGANADLFDGNLINVFLPIKANVYLGVLVEIFNA